MTCAKQRTPAAKFDNIPGSLPYAVIPADTDLQHVTETALRMLNEWTLSDLTEQIIWRDFLAFTGTYRTLYSLARVFRIFQQRSTAKKRSVCQPTEREARISRSLEDSAWIDVDFDFTTQERELLGRCSGTVSVVLDQEGRWRIWMLRTWLESFDGHGHPDTLEPAAQLHNGSSSCAASQNGNVNGGSSPFDAIIIGGGQSGLAIAGRLQALSVKYLVLEKSADIGDAWKNRYESLRWHTIKEYGHLPFGRTFEEEDPVFVPAKRIGEGHKAWSIKYGLRIATNAPIESASWDEDEELWTVTASVSGNQTLYTCKNLILCIGGGSSSPVVPTWAGPQRIVSSNFRGTIMHSKDYHSSTPWAGKRGIVVGTANTGHDVAEDMVGAGLHTTMMQRNATFVFPVEWLHAAQTVDYNRTKPTERGDREVSTYPMKISREMTNRAVHRAIKDNPERFDALENAGFRVDRFGDISNNLYARFGGHYVDTGASARIANGEIRIETKAAQSLTPNGLLLENGKELNADLIVLCTGFDHNFQVQAKRIIGDVADQMDEYYGVDEEGEVRGYAKIAGHPHLYYHGGDVRMARWFSRFIALRIQADALGVPLGIYRE